MSLQYSLRIVRRLVPGSLLLVLSFPARAQKPAAPPASQPTLEQVLTRAHENFEAYRHSVPNVFADEHLVSAVKAESYSGGGMSTGSLIPARNETIDSIFRLKRSNAQGDAVVLDEARQIVSFNHRPPAPDQSLVAPNIVRGAFSYATSFISPALESCYDYRLETNQRLHGAAVLVVDYDSKKLVPRSAMCPITEPNSGRAFLDPASMQVVRYEQKRPKHEYDRHTLGSWSAIEAGTLTTWTWSIDYAPVTLEGRTFWLPKTISSKTVTNTGPSVEWSFATSYSNYHLMDVHSTILPGLTDEPHQ